MYFNSSFFYVDQWYSFQFFQKFQRSERQGDPLSPFLFVIVMEALSRMIAAAIDHGLISRFSVGASLSEMVNISHLLFADDTLVFCGANFDQVRSIKALLVSFEAVSNLKVNLAKSSLISVGDVDNLDDLANILGCGMASLPLKYLGLPLGVSFKAKPVWDDIVEKVDHRLASWKRQYLSKGCRVTLIKSTLSNLPTYFLSLSYTCFCGQSFREAPMRFSVGRFK